MIFLFLFSLLKVIPLFSLLSLYQFSPFPSVELFPSLSLPFISLPLSLLLVIHFLYLFLFFFSHSSPLSSPPSSPLALNLLSFLASFPPSSSSLVFSSPHHLSSLIIPYPPSPPSLLCYLLPLPPTSFPSLITPLPECPVRSRRQNTKTPGRAVRRGERWGRPAAWAAVPLRRIFKVTDRKLQDAQTNLRTPLHLVQKINHEKCHSFEGLP